MATDENMLSRSEELRQRRNARAQQQRAQQTAQPQYTTPVRTRPVTVRGNAFGSPVHEQARNRGRRQYYIAMEGAGAELRLPALPMINPGWRLLSGFIAVFALVAIVAFYAAPLFAVETINLKGNQFITSEMLLQALDVSNLSIIEINPAELHDDLMQRFPEIASASVTVGLPATLEVTVVERQPVMSWVVNNATYVVDSEGVTFTPRLDYGSLFTILGDVEPPVAKQTPEIDPESPDSAALKAQISPYLGKMDLLLLQTAQKLGALLPAGTQLVYNGLNGFGWQESNGAMVYIGQDLSHFDARMSAYQTIANQLAQQGIQPTLISVEHLNAPFYRAVEQPESEDVEQ